MIWSPLLYSTLLLLSGVICLAIFLLAWRRRTSPGAAALIVMLAGAVIWAWTYAVYWLFPDSPAPFFWLDMTYIGVVICPTAFFVFAAQLTDHASWINKRTIWMFVIIPVLTLAILWTDPFHGLFFAGKRLPTATDIFDGGPWFWVTIVYSYALILGGYVLIFYSYFRQSGLYRRQSLLILLGSVFAPLVNVLSFLKLTPFPGLDLTPIVFTLQGVFYTFGILRLSLFDLVPVAKEILINSMREGMLIIDRSGRLVDLNHTALHDLNITREQAIGSSAIEIMAAWPGLLSFWQSKPANGSHVQIGFNQNQTRVVNVNSLSKTDSRVSGWLITWIDVTELVAAEQDLKKVNEQLENRLEEIQRLQEVLREQAIHDPLTGLLNRWFLRETLDREAAHAKRKYHEVWFLMIDIDAFKQVNDRFGHAAGDFVLQRVAQILSENSRAEDFVFRMGGEEFLITMSDISKEKCLARAEDIRRKVEMSAISYQNQVHSVTVSIGAAVYSPDAQDIEEAIRDADRALYRAKAAGKNCVV